MTPMHLHKWLLTAISVLFVEMSAAAVVEMPSRAAPTSLDNKTSKNRDESYLSSLPYVGIRSLPPPSTYELFNRVLKSSTDPKKSISFGRSVAGHGVDGRIVLRPGIAAFIVEVESPTALHIRTGWRFVDEATYTLTALVDDVPSRGPSNQTGHQLQGDLRFVWSPVTNGARQRILIERNGEPDKEWTATLEIVAHFDVAVPGAADSATAKALGESAFCQADIVCLLDVLPPSEDDVVLGASRGVALLILTDARGGSGTCTGTLLNTARYPQPYLLTAQHCIEQAVTFDALWFFSRLGCGFGPVSPAVQTSGGATIVWSSRALDSAFLLLASDPPNQVSYAGWNANPIAAQTTILAIHHPRGDVKKGSFGDVAGVNPITTTIGGSSYPAGSLYLIDWYLGIVEPGSSGSGFFTFNPQRNALQLRGTLTGGNTSCGGAFSRTYYQRLDYIYPFIATYLTTSAPPPPPAPALTAVEYYHSGFDHYFFTSIPGEISALDAGQATGWRRTGQTFNVNALGTAGTSNICRFFSASFAPRSSHFYTPFVSECESARRLPAWQFEGEVSAAKTPDLAGACPSGTDPLYRVYNNGKSGAPNHRYTASLAIRSQMIGQGWSPEGYGPIGVIACIPR